MKEKRGRKAGDNLENWEFLKVTPPLQLEIMIMFSIIMLGIQYNFYNRVKVAQSIVSENPSCLAFDDLQIFRKIL